MFLWKCSVAWWTIDNLRTACPCKNVSSSWLFLCIQVLTLQFQLNRAVSANFLLNLKTCSNRCHSSSWFKSKYLMYSQIDHNTRLYIQYQHLHSLWNHEVSAQHCHKFQKVVGWGSLNCFSYLHIHQWSFYHISFGSIFFKGRWKSFFWRSYLKGRWKYLFKTFCLLLALFFWTLLHAQKFIDFHVINVTPTYVWLSETILKLTFNFLSVFVIFI